MVKRYTEEWYQRKAKELLEENEKVKDILYLYLQGFGYKEISEKLKLPYGTVTYYLYILRKGKVITSLSDFTILRRRLERIRRLIENFETNFIYYKTYNKRILDEIKKELSYTIKLAQLLEYRYQGINPKIIKGDILGRNRV